jgi:hypothetical protein
MRTARLCALVPGLTALGMAVALAQAKGRGELLALAALGARPLRVVLGAAGAAWLLGGVALALLWSDLVDLGALFPVVQSSTPWVAVAGDRGSAALQSEAHGVRIGPDGLAQFISVQSASADGSQFAHTQTVAALCVLGPLVVVTPLWIGKGLSLLARLLGVCATVGAVVFLLHAAAVEQAPGPALLLSGLPFALQLRPWRALWQ